jgi:hypothetical protein
MRSRFGVAHYTHRVHATQTQIWLAGPLAPLLAPSVGCCALEDRPGGRLVAVAWLLLEPAETIPAGLGLATPVSLYKSELDSLQFDFLERDFV